MRTTNTLILGGGQAGLALSRCLTALGCDHLVVERGRIAERWHSERWNSLRLLTPNWMTRLPGWSYDGPDPDGFMTASEVASFFGRYAASFAAPVHEHTTVEHVTTDADGFVVTTSDDKFRSDNVVIATGWCDRPAVPALGRHLSTRIHQVVPADYRSPDDVPTGDVLVVGASATGVQLADELHRSGRRVTVAVGSHSRISRRYRGLDIFRWLDLIRAFDKTIDDVGDVTAVRSEPSLQLVGRDDHRTLDLATLQADGVRLVGRLNSVDGTRVTLATNLHAVIDAADRQMTRVLSRIDAAIERLGLTAEVFDAEPIAPVPPVSVPSSLDLDAAGISTIVWATGHRRPYQWLDLPILDRHGEICQYRGITPVPGAYVLGQRFQHYRNSNFIDGVGRDAHYVAERICRTRRQLSAVSTGPLSEQK
jgi:putative flavoprotein involved in K+ transport